MDQSLERIIPDQVTNHKGFEGKTLALHLERYHYAGAHMKSGNIADVACGVGYGSYLLAKEYGENIKQIIAADLSVEAIQYAKANYAHEKIDFIVANVLELNFRTQLDTIISLETIEHLESPHLFVQHMSKQLCMGGRFIASVPITPSMDANPYHLHDFTAETFRRIFETNGFRQIDSFIQVQSYRPFSVLQKSSVRQTDLRKNILSYYLKHPGKFFLRLRSILTDGFKNKYLVAAFEKL